MNGDWDDDRAERNEACDGRRGTCITPPEKCPACRWGELATYEDVPPRYEDVPRVARPRTARGKS